LARWIIGLLIVGLAAVGGFTLLKRYSPSAETAPGTELDSRVSEFVKQGDQLLANGDIEGAKDQYIRASGINESDPRVTGGLARIELIRADQHWLHLLLLAEDAPNRPAVTSALRRSIQRVDEATKRVMAKAPGAPGNARLRIGLLRLQGDRDAARKLVGALRGSEPDDALELAALDLVEEEPSWSAVIDRLRTAVRAEKKLGRAHAMLVYALARAGKKETAERQLRSLKTKRPDHPLLRALGEFVDASVEGPADDAGAGDADVEDGGDDEIPADFREALRRAKRARRAGQLDRAERLYQAALEKNPGNSEALAGLADLAQARGDSTQAIVLYESLLSHNPGYIPAVAALADLKWQSGSQSEALTLYRQIVQSAPGTSYARRAQQRIDAAEKAPEPPPEPPPTATTTEQPTTAPPATETGEPTEPAPTTTDEPPPEPPPEPTADPPHIDTSDLPE
jgi:tetratricopeptide (TPR) repeat protein